MGGLAPKPPSGGRTFPPPHPLEHRVWVGFVDWSLSCARLRWGSAGLRNRWG
jgi:hypothetical protein